MGYINTIVNDDFPLGRLECQFFDECKFYTPNKCSFGEPCKELQVYNGTETTVRAVHRAIDENYIEVDNLKFQVSLIHGDGKR